METRDRNKPVTDRSPSPPSGERLQTEVAPPSAGAVSVGALVAGRYRVERPLGRGGIGVVYLVRDEQVAERHVALKVLLESAAVSEWLCAKFEDERRALARLHHPNIVMITDAGTLPSGQPFLVMEYVPGPTLRTLLSEPALAIHAVAAILVQLGRAVAAAHASGVIHRDLKPENVIVQDLGDGERLVKVIDFGVATLHEALAQATHTTRAAGTRAYMSPEQLRGRPTPASDVYAIAAIAYEMLTGRLPFSAVTDVDLLDQQRQGLAQPPSAWRPGLPPACDDLIRSGLSFGADRRPASAREFAETLAAALLASEGRGAAPALRANRVRALRLAVSLLAVAGVVSGAVAAGRWWPRHGATETAPRPRIAESAVAYTILVQRFRDGRPYRTPFALPGPMLFAVDDRIRLAVSSPRAGFLYVLNEGPAPDKGPPSYNLLFPSTSTRAGSARLPASEEIQIPGETWLVFDEEQGTEKLWLVWATREIPALDGVRTAANPTQRGEIRDERQRHAVRDFLARHVDPTLAPARDVLRGRTLLRASGDTLVGVIELEHR